MLGSLRLGVVAALLFSTGSCTGEARARAAKRRTWAEVAAATRRVYAEVGAYP